MVWKDKRKFHTAHHVTIITLPIIGIVTSGTLSALPLVLLNQNYASMAQQPQQEQQPKTNGNSFQLGNTTFSHNMATVNSIPLHYVIGGHGPPVEYHHIHSLLTSILTLTEVICQ